MARKLIVEIVGDSRSLERSLGRAEDRTNTFGTTLKSLGKTAALTAGAAGVGAVAITLKAGIDEYIQTTKVAAQTAAVIRSTGKAANVTAKHVNELADSLLHQSGVDDELIKSGENVLLTFKGIRNEVGKGNDIFDQATKATLDLSVATGKSLPSAARLVGRALQDPIKGMGSLRRVGVQLTDAQEDQVKAFIKAGETMKAQKIILGELNDRVGGSAKALGQTLPGQINIVRESFKNWAGELVTRMIPVLERLVAWVREHWPEIRKTILDAWAAIKPTLVALADLVVEIVRLFQQHWPQIKPVVKEAAQTVKAQLAVITHAMEGITDLLRGDWSAAWSDWKGVVKSSVLAVSRILTLQSDVWAKIMRNVGKRLAQLILKPINAVIDELNAFKIPGVGFSVRGHKVGTPSVDPIPNIPHIGGGTTVVHTTVNLDGQKVADNTTKHQTRRNRGTAVQRSGRNAGIGLIGH